MLTAAQKEQWLKDLRSGEFKQGKSRLCSIYPDGSEHYCCLGVLAHRQSIHCELEKVDDALTRKVYYFKGDESGYAGITPNSLYWDAYVVALNDEGAPFSEIADWIEANVVTKG